MADSLSRFVRVTGGGFRGSAPAGHCAPWLVFRASSLQFPCRCRQHPSGLPCLPAVLASSFENNSSVSSPLHSSLLAALSSGPLLTTWYFPLAPFSFLLFAGSYVVCLLSLAAVSFVTVSSVLSCSTLAVPRVIPCPYLDLPPAFLLPPPLSHGLLCPPVSPLAPPPPVPAANIPHKENMSAIGRAGMRLSGRLCAGLCLTGSSLTGSLPWWGSKLAVPCYYTVPNSSTQCNVGQHSGTRMSWRTGRGGAGQVAGAAAAPLNHLTDPSDRQTTYCRTYTKPLIRVSPFLFRPPNALATAR